MALGHPLPGPAPWEGQGAGFAGNGPPRGFGLGTTHPQASLGEGLSRSPTGDGRVGNLPQELGSDTAQRSESPSVGTEGPPCPPSASRRPPSGTRCLRPLPVPSQLCTELSDASAPDSSSLVNAARLTAAAVFSRQHRELRLSLSRLGQRTASSRALAFRQVLLLLCGLRAAHQHRTFR